MKIKTTSQTIKNAIRILNPVIKSNNTLPILNDILLSIDKETSNMSITASDLEIHLISNISVEILDEKGISSFTLNSKLLLDLLSNLSDTVIEIIPTNNYGAEIKTNNASYAINGNNPDDFIKIKEVDFSNKVLIDYNKINTGLSKTMFACGNDELRPVMSSVFVSIEDKELTMVATDAQILSKYTNIVETDKNISFLLPQKGCNILNNILNNYTSYSNIDVVLEGNVVVFKIDNVVLYVRCVEGKYPNFNSVIPTENPISAFVYKQEIYSSIKRLSYFTNKTSNLISMSLTDNSLSIQSEDIDYSVSAKEQYTCSKVGNDITIGFNGKKAKDVLSVLSGEQVEIKMSEPSRPMIFSSVITEDTYNHIVLLMPMILSN